MSDHTELLTFVRMACDTCGFLWLAPAHYRAKRAEDGRHWWCVSCGQRHFYGDTDLQLLQRKVEAQAKSINFWQQRARDEEARVRAEARSKAAIKGQLTKMKTRVSNGVCPCCQRSFANVRRHMASKHPDFAASKEGTAS